MGQTSADRAADGKAEDDFNTLRSKKQGYFCQAGRDLRFRESTDKILNSRPVILGGFW